MSPFFTVFFTEERPLVARHNHKEAIVALCAAGADPRLGKSPLEAPLAYEDTKRFIRQHLRGEATLVGGADEHMAPADLTHDMRLRNVESQEAIERALSML